MGRVIGFLDDEKQSQPGVKILGKLADFEQVFAQHNFNEVIISISWDHEEAIKKRIADYHAKTEPMLQFFRRLGILVDINASQTIPKVHDDTKAALGLPEPRFLNSLTLHSERELAKGLPS